MNCRCSKCGEIIHEGDSAFVCIDCHKLVCEDCWRKGQGLCPDEKCKGTLQQEIV